MLVFQYAIFLLFAQENTEIFAETSPSDKYQLQDMAEYLKVKVNFDLDEVTITRLLRQI